MLAAGSGIDCDLLAEGFVATELQAQITAGFQNLCGQRCLTDQAVIYIQICTLGLGVKALFAPGWQQGNIYRLGGAQPGDINFLMQRKVAVLAELYLVKTAANALDSAWHLSSGLAIYRARYAVYFRANHKIAGQRLQHQL